MNSRKDLANYFAQLGFKRGAEVGVFEGSYSKTLLDSIPDLNLLCVDSWSSSTGWGREKNVAAYAKAQALLAPYPQAIIIKGPSVEVAKNIADESLDFVYIDADHSYESVKADINAWAPKVRKGGVISGHDYFHPPGRTMGVIPAVDEYAQAHGLEVKSTGWDNNNPIRDERHPNWYCTK